MNLNESVKNWEVKECTVGCVHSIAYTKHAHNCPRNMFMLLSDPGIVNANFLRLEAKLKEKDCEIRRLERQLKAKTEIIRKMNNG